MRSGRMLPVGLIASFVSLAIGGGGLAMDHSVMKMTKDGVGSFLTDREYPLYYWAGDKAPGDTKGQGVGNVWYVIDPARFPPKM